MIRLVRVGLHPTLVGLTAGRDKGVIRIFRKILCPQLLVTYQI